MKPVRLGLIKGGQLGRMLLQAAAAYPVICSVMDSDASAPCRAFAGDFFVGDPLNPDDVYAFGRSLDAVTLEFEHVSIEGLKRLEKEGVRIFPRPQILEMIQDKAAQKSFYQTLKIPSPEYIIVNERKDLLMHVDFLPAVQKLRKSGYDGKGVLKLNTAGDFEKAFDAPSFIEKEVPFTKEISVIGVRSSTGEIKTYPLAETVADPVHHLLDYLFSPADVSESVALKACGIVQRILEALDFTGILAVEMFVTEADEVLVNEMSPRPHNSGHHTIEANRTSQYEQLLRAILGLPLGEPDLISPAATVNLLGRPQANGPVFYEGLPQVLGRGGVYLHLYGKNETKPFRKMGHATVLHPDVKKAIAIAQEVRREIKIGAH